MWSVGHVFQLTNGIGPWGPHACRSVGHMFQLTNGSVAGELKCGGIQFSSRWCLCMGTRPGKPECAVPSLGHVSPMLLPCKIYSYKIR